MHKYTTLLIGNPNVGKTSLFNNLTGLNHHTGNWAGKTVERANGSYKYKNNKYTVIDLPGIYSLNENSLEEKVTCEYLKKNAEIPVIVICDETILERNIYLALEVIEISKNVILCLSMHDEAIKNGIEVDINKLKEILKVDVVQVNARDGEGVVELKKIIEQKINNNEIKKDEQLKKENAAETIEQKYNRCEKIVNECVKNVGEENNKSYKIDNFILSKLGFLSLMSFIVGFILWLTIVATNVPSQMLFNMFIELEVYLVKLLEFIHTPQLLIDVLIDGVYTTLTWVVSVMLPPMTVFFPLFTILEDTGVLPRIAFNVDGLFKKAKSNGKQIFTILMGFGCNAVGVTSSRIIENKKTREISIITNNLTPCNGRFPTIIILISSFLVITGNAFLIIGVVLFFIIVSFLVTLLTTYLLSKNIKENEIADSFVIELPKYRMPNILTVLKTSFLERTVYVLGRAIYVSIPVGVLIYFMQNTHVNDNTLLFIMSNFLDPAGQIMGLNGVILAAFILGFPANEIVLPIIFMQYMGTQTLTDLSDINAIKDLLIVNGFTTINAICMILFTMFHWPCSTTLITVKKETNSNYITFLAFVIPTIIGITICIIVNYLLLIFV